jgi:uncharacterized protein YeaO (DUF488 family)
LLKAFAGAIVRRRLCVDGFLNSRNPRSVIVAISVVRLGSPRGAHEGLRVGTVRRPPRGVPKAEFASRDFYDVWLPVLSPSPPLVTMALSATDAKTWQMFERKYRAEMKSPEAAHTIELLAALSSTTNFAVGCYCEDESHCHRSILRELLRERGAELA